MGSEEMDDSTGGSSVVSPALCAFLPPGLFVISPSLDLSFWTAVHPSTVHSSSSSHSSIVTSYLRLYCPRLRPSTLRPFDRCCLYDLQELVRVFRPSSGRSRAFVQRPSLSTGGGRRCGCRFGQGARAQLPLHFSVQTSICVTQTCWGFHRRCAIGGGVMLCSPFPRLWSPSQRTCKLRSLPMLDMSGYMRFIVVHSFLFRLSECSASFWLLVVRFLFYVFQASSLTAMFFF